MSLLMDTMMIHWLLDTLAVPIDESLMVDGKMFLNFDLKKLNYNFVMHLLLLLLLLLLLMPLVMIQLPN